MATLFNPFALFKVLRSRSPFEWWLVVKAVVIMGTIALALQLLPYSMWRRWAATTSRVRQGQIGRRAISTDALVRAIDTAGRVIPRGTNCLVRALTARTLMASYGLPTILSLGVAKASDGALAGHAWLKYQGHVLIGERGMEGSSELPDLEGRL